MSIGTHSSFVTPSPVGVLQGSVLMGHYFILSIPYHLQYNTTTHSLCCHPLTFFLILTLAVIPLSDNVKSLGAMHARCQRHYAASC